MLNPDQLERRNYFHNLGCPHKVTVEHINVSDAYGSKTWADPVEYDARVEDKTVMVQAADGTMRAATGRVVFAFPAPVLDIRDRLTIPVPVTASHPTGKKRIGQLLDVRQDPTGSGQQATVAYY